MKENVIDVLMYLLENYMEEGADFEPDEEILSQELVRAGFRQAEIGKAFDWLEGLSALRENPQIDIKQGHVGSIRHYHDEELAKIDADCRGFLLFLEQCGAIDPATREMVIERVMALDVEEINLEQLKWVVLMILFNQPGMEQAYPFLEELVLEHKRDIMH